MSGWLNDHLDFDGGEDYGKLADKPMTLCDTTADICKTQRREIADYLLWAAGRIAAAGDKSTRTLNRLRLMRNMAAKVNPQEP